jgi:hypothetical protein
MTAAEGTAAFLRAYLQGDEHGLPDGPGQPADGLAPLVHATFVIAARRTFALTWTRAAVILYVAEVRAALSECPGLIDPRAAEHELRRALGDLATPGGSPSSAATAQLILLKSMTVSLQLDRAGIDELVKQASRKPTELSAATVRDHRLRPLLVFELHPSACSRSRPNGP